MSLEQKGCGRESKCVHCLQDGKRVRRTVPLSLPNRDLRSPSFRPLVSYSITDIVVTTFWRNKNDCASTHGHTLRINAVAYSHPLIQHRNVHKDESSDKLRQECQCRPEQIINLNQRLRDYLTMYRMDLRTKEMQLKTKTWHRSAYKPELPTYSKVSEAFENLF